MPFMISWGNAAPSFVVSVFAHEPFKTLLNSQSEGDLHQCHGLAPWCFTLAANRHCQVRRAKMPPACPVEVHALGSSLPCIEYLERPHVSLHRASRWHPILPIRFLSSCQHDTPRGMPVVSTGNEPLLPTPPALPLRLTNASFTRRLNFSFSCPGSLPTSYKLKRRSY
jgi:hypothetical protein